MYGQYEKMICGAADKALHAGPWNCNLPSVSQVCLPANKKYKAGKKARKAIPLYSYRRETR
jgi:hypothetical protein